MGRGMDVVVIVGFFKLLFLCLETVNALIVLAEGNVARERVDGIFLRCDVTGLSSEDELIRVTWYHLDKNSGKQVEIFTADLTNDQPSYHFSSQWTGRGYFGGLSLADIHLPAHYVTRDMAGNYRCTVTSALSRGQTDVTVQVQHGPGASIAISPGGRVETREGAALHLTCSADCIPPCSYRWYRSGRRVSSAAVFRLPHVQRHHAGLYACQAKNKEGRSIKPVDVRVRFPAAVTSLLLHRQETPPPAAATLTCRAEGWPEPDITWSGGGRGGAGRRGEELYNSSAKGSEIEGGMVAPERELGTSVSRFHLSPVTCRHNGDIACSATNGLDPPSVRKLRLSLPCPPSPLDDTGVCAGGMPWGEKAELIVKNRHVPIHLRLCFFGSPEPRVSFQHLGSGDELMNEYRGDVECDVMQNVCTSSLRLNITSSREYGVYKAVVANRYGRFTETVTLVSRQPPWPPVNLTVQNVTLNSACVVWVAGYNGGSRQMFNVTYHILSELLDKKDEVIVMDYLIVEGDDAPAEGKQRGNFSVCFDKLASASNYTVSCTAYNEFGSGNVSASLTFSTQDESTTSATIPTTSTTTVFASPRTVVENKATTPALWQSLGASPQNLGSVVLDPDIEEIFNNGNDIKFSETSFSTAPPITSLDHFPEENDDVYQLSSSSEDENDEEGYENDVEDEDDEDNIPMSLFPFLDEYFRPSQGNAKSQNRSRLLRHSAPPFRLAFYKSNYFTKTVRSRRVTEVSLISPSSSSEQTGVWLDNTTFANSTSTPFEETRTGLTPQVSSFSTRALAISTSALSSFIFLCIIFLLILLAFKRRGRLNRLRKQSESRSDHGREQSNKVVVNYGNTSRSSDGTMHPPGYIRRGQIGSRPRMSTPELGCIRRSLRAQTVRCNSEAESSRSRVDCMTEKQQDSVGIPTGYRHPCVRDSPHSCQVDRLRIQSENNAALRRKSNNERSGRFSQQCSGKRRLPPLPPLPSLPPRHTCPVPSTVLSEDALTLRRPLPRLPCPTIVVENPWRTSDTSYLDLCASDQSKTGRHSDAGAHSDRGYLPPQDTLFTPLDSSHSLSSSYTSLHLPSRRSSYSSIILPSGKLLSDQETSNSYLDLYEVLNKSRSRSPSDIYDPVQFDAGENEDADENQYDHGRSGRYQQFQPQEQQQDDHHHHNQEEEQFSSISRQDCQQPSLQGRSQDRDTSSQGLNALCIGPQQQQQEQQQLQQQQQQNGQQQQRLHYHFPSNTAKLHRTKSSKSIDNKHTKNSELVYQFRPRIPSCPALPQQPKPCPLAKTTSSPHSPHPLVSPRVPESKGSRGRKATDSSLEPHRQRTSHETKRSISGKTKDRVRQTVGVMNFPPGRCHKDASATLEDNDTAATQSRERREKEDKLYANTCVTPQNVLRSGEEQTERYANCSASSLTRNHAFLALCVSPNSLVDHDGDDDLDVVEIKR